MPFSEENAWEILLLLYSTCLKNTKAFHCVLIRKLRVGREKKMHRNNLESEILDLISFLKVSQFH